MIRMRKKIKDYDDIRLIIKYKADMTDPKGNKVDFVRFLSFTLLDIVNIINEGTWSYEVE